ncbi:MAG: nuclear transport factor 2 family protein, partial [Halapricum sp.]
MEMSPGTVVERIVEAQNDHDLEGMLEWFAPDYQTETPVHPERNFTGSDQVRETWETVFRTTPDFEATVVNLVEDGDTVWAELRHSGTQVDGTRIDKRGVILFGVEDGLLSRGRVYL